MSPEKLWNTVPRSDYRMWQMILKDSKMSKNIQNVSASFGVKKQKAEAIIEEYQLTGCMIIQSKMNFK